MSVSGPTGEELIEVSRSHALRCQPMFIMTTFVGALGMQAVLENLEDHLAYWAELEKRSVLFAAGPRLPVDLSEPWSGEGLVIFRAPNLEAAQKIAEDDPMHSRGARKFEVWPWLLNHLVSSAPRTDSSAPTRSPIGR